MSHESVLKWKYCIRSSVSVYFFGIWIGSLNFCKPCYQTLLLFIIKYLNKKSTKVIFRATGPLQYSSRHAFKHSCSTKQVIQQHMDGYNYGKTGKSLDPISWSLGCAIRSFPKYTTQFYDMQLTTNHTYWIPTNKNQLLRVSSWMVQSVSSSTRCSWVCELCWSEIRSPNNFQL